MRTFSTTTLGCKANQHDGQAIAAFLRRAGLGDCDCETRPPGLLVVNTCCVTATAMRKSRQAIRRAVRSAPRAAVLIAGCYSGYDGQRIGALLDELGVPPHRRALVAHHDDVAACLDRFVRRLADRAAPSAHDLAARDGDGLWMKASCDARTTASPASITTRRQAAVKANVRATAGLPALDQFAGHQRAFVKVQDGCDAFCAYCVVPFTRPRVWSRPLDDVLDECRRLVAAGHKEIVLCGIFLGAFGRDTAIRRRWGDGPSRLPELLRRVAAIDGLWRVRLSSLEPQDVTDDLLAAFADLPNAAPHFHLPLQSGSDRILRRMNRRYTVRQYRATVGRIRSAVDRPALTTDIIVGFPGEDDEDFAATLDTAMFAGFAKIHAFPFSPVAGTAAWRRRREAPPPDVVKARMAALADLEKRLAGAYRRRFVGLTLEALVERPRPGARRLRAMTDRYLAVTFPAPAPAPRGDGPGAAEAGDLTGRIVRVRIRRITAAGLAGQQAD